MFVYSYFGCNAVDKKRGEEGNMYEHISLKEVEGCKVNAKQNATCRDCTHTCMYVCVNIYMLVCKCETSRNLVAYYSLFLLAALSCQLLIKCHFNSISTL